VDSLPILLDRSAFPGYTEGNRLDCDLAVSREEKVSFMRSHASGIERLLVRPLPLALVLGLLCAALSGLAAARWQVAYAANPSVAIVSPTSPQGPVQTGIQVVGAGWNPSANIQVFYNAPANNQPCGDPNNSQNLAQTNKIPGVSTQVAQPDGSWKIDFLWPTTATGQFYVCAFDSTTPTQVTPSTQPFDVLSATPPSISVDKSTPNIGDQITVTGLGFLPGNQPVDLFLAQPGQQTGTSLGTVTVAPDGSFSQKVTLPTSPSGQLSIVALSRTPVSDALPPLDASVPITVGATASTPTPTPAGTVTPSPTTTTTTTTTGTSTPSASGLILVALIVVLVLVILAIFGVLIWYVAGTRPPAGYGAPSAPPPPGRSRVPVAAPRRGQGGWQSQPGWQTEDEWEGVQGPWEEDEQGGWNDLPTQWGDESNPWPQDQGGQSGPGAPPSWSGPAGRGNAGVQRPAPPRGPNRDDRPGRARPGQDGW
jgi:hypothetical protein